MESPLSWGSTLTFRRDKSPATAPHALGRAAGFFPLAVRGFVMFELWRHEKSDSGVSRCFARRTEDQVKPQFHSLRVGEWRTISDDDRAEIAIVRVK
jgi:hypothetical protein